jgi:four helix bundle protein
MSDRHAKIAAIEPRLGGWPDVSDGTHHAFSRGVEQPVDDLRGGEGVRERAFRFACDIVKFCERLLEIGGVARIMAPQLLNSGTALYPMLEEARAAESRRDFISKCSIGLKEMREAHGRLRIHERTAVGPAAEARRLRMEANELVAIVTRIVGNTRTNSSVSSLRRSARSYIKVVDD